MGQESVLRKEQIMTIQISSLSTIFKNSLALERIICGNH